MVWKITGVRQRETVPDRALSRADDIEVVDITPDELRERMAAGKVYVPETARLASENFFKVENLTALRELAEETGVTAKLIGLIDVVDGVFTSRSTAFGVYWIIPA